MKRPTLILAALVLFLIAGSASAAPHFTTIDSLVHHLKEVADDLEAQGELSRTDRKRVRAIRSFTHPIDKASAPLIDPNKIEQASPILFNSISLARKAGKQLGKRFRGHSGVEALLFRTTVAVIDELHTEASGLLAFFKDEANGQFLPPRKQAKAVKAIEASLDRIGTARAICDGVNFPEVQVDLKKPALSDVATATAAALKELGRVAKPLGKAEQLAWNLVVESQLGVLFSSSVRVLEPGEAAYLRLDIAKLRVSSYQVNYPHGMTFNREDGKGTSIVVASERGGGFRIDVLAVPGDPDFLGEHHATGEPGATARIFRIPPVGHEGAEVEATGLLFTANYDGLTGSVDYVVTIDSSVASQPPRTLTLSLNYETIRWD